MGPTDTEFFGQTPQLSIPSTVQKVSQARKGQKESVDESGIRTHANYLTTILKTGRPERSALDRSAISPN